MVFDINELTKEFKNTVDWMLLNKFANDVKDQLHDCRNNKNILEKDPDSLDALRMIIELLKTSGYHFKRPENFNNKMDTFIKEHGTNFRTSMAKNELIMLVGENRRSNIEQLLNYQTIKDFTTHLHTLSMQGKKEVLGKKGRDDYLRTFGYWDRIPMDIHEKRFIIRSGIYHTHSARDKNDPFEEGSLHDALTRFCSVHLKGKVVEGIDLGDAPGIVDIFIWQYSAEERYNICGKIPNCHECTLKSVCLYAIINSI